MKLERDHATSKADDGVDFGPEAAFRSLKGQCFKLEQPKYTYEVCPFDRATQVEKQGSRRTTSLGSWSGGGWEAAAASPEVEHGVMHFKGGEKCFNGPQREAIVQLDCSDTDEVSSVLCFCCACQNNCLLSPSSTIARSPAA